MTCEKRGKQWICTTEDEDILIGEYQIPSKIVCRYKGELMEGNIDARRTFYQNIAPYAPRTTLEKVHKWKRGACEYYARELLDELTEYKVCHPTDYTSTNRFMKVVQLMKEYNYLDDEDDI